MLKWNGVCTCTMLMYGRLVVLIFDPHYMHVYEGLAIWRVKDSKQTSRSVDDLWTLDEGLSGYATQR